MGLKISLMNDLWVKLATTADARKRILNVILDSAERFWLQFQNSQSSISALRQQYGSIFASTQQSFDVIQQHIKTIGEDHIPLCLSSFEQTQIFLGRLYELINCEEERQFLQQHMALLESQWNTFLYEFSGLKSRLLEASEKVLPTSLLYVKLYVHYYSKQILTLCLKKQLDFWMKLMKNFVILHKINLLPIRMQFTHKWNPSTKFEL